MLLNLIYDFVDVVKYHAGAFLLILKLWLKESHPVSFFETGRVCPIESYWAFIMSLVDVDEHGGESHGDINKVRSVLMWQLFFSGKEQEALFWRSFWWVTFEWYYEWLLCMPSQREEAYGRYYLLQVLFYNCDVFFHHSIPDCGCNGVVLVLWLPCCVNTSWSSSDLEFVNQHFLYLVLHNINFFPLIEIIHRHQLILFLLLIMETIQWPL